MINNLLDNHPKTASLICEWFQQQFIKSLEDQNLPKDFVEGAKSFVIDNEKVNGLIGKQPRGLFDFFDGHSIFISILHNEKKGWELRIGDSKKGKYHLTRKEAEMEGVEQSFKILEERLNKDAGVSEADTSGGGE